MNGTIYPMPNGTDTYGIYEFFRYVNGVSGGIFFATILFVIWVVSFTSLLASGDFNRPSASKAFTFSSFFVMVLSIMLSIMDLLATRWMYMAIVFTAIGTGWLYIENARQES